MLSGRVSNERGVCLMEMMVAVAAGAVVLSATLQMLDYCQRKFQAQQKSMAQQQDVRMGLEVIDSELRMAGALSMVLGSPLRKALPQEIQFSANLGGLNTILSQPVSASQQELAVQDGTDWPSGKRVVVCWGQHCAEGRLARNGQQSRLALSGPLNQSFPVGSEVFVSNEIRYYLGKDEEGVVRVMRQVDGGANPIIGDVSWFKLVYFDKDGKPTVDPDRVLRVRVEVAVGEGRKPIGQEVGLRA